MPETLLQAIIGEQSGTGAPFGFGLETSTAEQDHRAATFEGSWTEIARTSRVCRVIALGLMEEIFHDRPGRVSTSEALRATFSTEVLSQILAEGRRDEFLAEVAALGDPDLTVADAEAVFAEIEVGGQAAPAAVDLATLDHVGETLGLLTRGCLSRVHEAFNASVAGPTTLTVNDPDAETEAAGALIAELGATCAEVRETFHALAAARDAPEAYVDAHSRLGRRLRADSARAARALAHLHGRIRAHLNGGAGGKGEAVARIAILGHEHIRSALALDCAAFRLAVAAYAPAADDDARQVLASARDLSLGGSLPNGIDRDIHALGPEDEGRFVEVMGRITAMSAEIEQDDRLIGRIELTDPSSGAASTLVALFVNPPRVGMVEGGFVRASGTYSEALDLAGGVPGLLVDQLALTTLAGQRWWLAFEALGYKFMPRFRARANLAWTVGPHLPGSGNLDTEPGGASEVLFLQFGRSADVEEDP